MSEDKSVRDLQKELVRARRREAAERKVEKNRRLDHIGLEPNEDKRERPGSADIPDYIGLPKKRKRSENKW